jgi:hypothetical protein
MDTDKRPSSVVGGATTTTTTTSDEARALCVALFASEAFDRLKTDVSARYQLVFVCQTSFDYRC